jgi:hypothetical protein
MKNKKKLKKIKEELDAWENRGVTPTGTLVAIRDIVDSTHQEEPEPEFVPGDKVVVSYSNTPLYGEEFAVEELADDGEALISVWIDVEHLIKV